MAIPMSALRRALAEMADMSGSASLRRSIPAALNNTVGASVGGASLGAAGGLLANMPDEDSGETLDQYGNRLMRGIGTGAAIGAGLGAGSVGFAGARGLRQALAEAASERGIGRAAAREASHVDDAARFGEAMAPRRTPSHMTPKADVMLRMLHDNPNITDEELGLAVWGDDIRAGLVDEDTAIALVPRYRERLAAAGQWNPQ